MYEVVKRFYDLQDGEHKYEVGDEYPRLGLKPSVSRIKELMGNDNKQGVPLIKELPDITEEKPKRGRKKKTEN